MGLPFLLTALLKSEFCSRSFKVEDTSLSCVFTLGFCPLQIALLVLGSFSLVGDWLWPWVTESPGASFSLSIR